MNVPIERAIAATHARTVNAEAMPAALRVVTDSRAIAPGDAFLALRGDRFDGHAFVRAALERGAAVAIVDDPSAVPEGAPALVVADTAAALGALGAQARALLRGRVVAITGSTGKTTTKEFCAQLLRHAGLRVAATHANENNEIGVPKLFLGADEDADVVVAELGARRYGDIAPLVAIARPDVAALTNVGDAHLEIMGSPQRLAETKWQIFSTGAQAVLNEHDEVCLRRRPTLDGVPWWFGTKSADSRNTPEEPCAEIVTDAAAGRNELARFERGAVELVPIAFRLPGAHNLRNLAAACAVAFALGIDTAAVAAGVASLELPGGRYERMRVGAFDVIFDAYNASMAGTLATLDAFARERAARRIAVLSSMAELGDGAAAMHERVGAAAAGAGLDALLVGGEHAGDLARGARDAGLAADRLVNFERNSDAVRWLRDHARSGDVVLLKGSRMYRLEEIVEGLRGNG